MGVSGVPWKCEKNRIISALKNNKGVITRTCAELECDPTTLRKRIEKDPELVELLNDLRHNLDTTILDMAENTLMYAMGLQKSDINAALKSTFYVLNNKGRSRGYEKLRVTEDADEDIGRKLVQAINDSEKVSGTQETGGSELAPEQPLLG